MPDSRNGGECWNIRHHSPVRSRTLLESHDLHWRLACGSSFSVPAARRRLHDLVAAAASVSKRARVACLTAVRSSHLHPRPRCPDRHAGGNQGPAQPCRDRARSGRALLPLAPRPHDGRRVWEALNVDFRNWPPSGRTTDIYLPQQVATDFQQWLGLAEHFEFMSQQGYTRVHTVPDRESIEITDVRITPFRLAEDYVYAFLFEEAGRRVLIAPANWSDGSRRSSPMASISRSCRWASSSTTR